MVNSFYLDTTVSILLIEITYKFKETMLEPFLTYFKVLTLMNVSSINLTQKEVNNIWTPLSLTRHVNIFMDLNVPSV